MLSSYNVMVCCFNCSNSRMHKRRREFNALPVVRCICHSRRKRYNETSDWRWYMACMDSRFAGDDRIMSKMGLLSPRVVRDPCTGFRRFFNRRTYGKRLCSRPRK